MRNKIEYLIKHNAAIQLIYKTLMSACFRFLGIFSKTDDSLVLFSSYSGKRFDDSPRAIFDAMKSRKECSNFRFVWAFNDPAAFCVEGASCVKMDSLAYFMTALRAKYWVTNVNIERGLHFKKKKTIYLNTWHGTPIKTIGNAVSGRSDYDFSNVDFISSDGPYFTEIMVRDFDACRERVIQCGRPCDDRIYASLSDELCLVKSKEKMGIDPRKKVVLYAPTWRDSINAGASYEFTPPINIDKWKCELGDEFHILFRAHSIMTHVGGIEFCDGITDVSAYPDINDLILASDILISDYSGTYFDFAITGRPMVCFCFDYDEYVSSRGVYFDIRDYVSSFDNEDDLLSFLNSFDADEESKKTRRFINEFAGYGGNAVNSCVDFLLKED